LKENAIENGEENVKGKNHSIVSEYYGRKLPAGDRTYRHFLLHH
jgi:hypothetical protein